MRSYAWGSRFVQCNEQAPYQIFLIDQINENQLQTNQGLQLTDLMQELEHQSQDSAFSQPILVKSNPSLIYIPMSHQEPLSLILSIAKEKQ